MTNTLDVNNCQLRIPSSQKPWAVILAGGDGVRLRPLSRLISGDDRPKQFCPVFGDRSLLAHTRKRLAGVTEEDKTMFVVTRAHESFYADELGGVCSGQVVVQPQNKGTGTAIVFALLRIAQRDPDAIVAFFPSDHFYSDESRFLAAVESAVETAVVCPDSLVLLGAEATHPETGYGWIEPGPAPAWNVAGHLHQVVRFWEKPSLSTAQVLQRQGCLWNTFVMAGRAGAFLRLLESTVPGLLRGFSRFESSGDVAAAYLDEVAPVDFSRQVLSRCSSELLVVRMAASVGWSDLGEPERVLATLAQAGMPLSMQPGLRSRQMQLRALYSSGTTPTDADSIAAVA